MGSYRRRALLVVAPLCAVAMLAAGPADGSDASDGDTGRDVSGQVVRLYEDAALATQRYEAGRAEAETQRVTALRAEAPLERERREITGLRADLGRIVRAQYRTGGLPLVAQLLLADDPAGLLEGQHAFSRADLAVRNAIGRRQRAETRLAADEARATAAWRKLERHNTELAALKDTVERKLEDARGRLQGLADASVAAGSCRGAVRLDQPQAPATAAWVAPVERYTLSAGFGSDGARWANRHTGQDFAVPIGSPVRAAGAGRVVTVSCGGPFGIEVVIEHAGGYYTQYAHLAAVAVDQGERVATGQWIGQSGTSGNSTGPHLHFEVRITPEAGSALDPVPWLAQRGVPLG
ncbi:M23 family metallopeptidase [Streptomyces sp. NPDC005574]|uniref:M23 family metallopeptidase n=1 Tax=Streptomyces sp. NPDC005574 TaxID=3156891 RepID=UPI0033A2A3F8